MEEHIEHHGILGMKWGKKNGPPYPLGSSDHSATEKKAGWRKSLDKSSSDKYTKNSFSNGESENKKHGLSEKQKKAIKIGATVAVTALAVYGGYKLKQSGKLDPLIDKGKDAVDQLLRKSKAGNADNISEWKVGDLSKLGSTQQKAAQIVSGIKKLAKAESLSDTLKNVNPHRLDSNYKNNCTLCSIASFLRQKGYDVTAGSTGGKPQNLGGIVEKCFKNAKVLDGSATKFGRSRQDAAEMLLKRYGQNAEGVCAIKFKNGRGHAFNWKIADGVVSFFDGQSGWDDSVVSRFWSRGLINTNDSLILARLDNAEIDFDAVKELLE